MQILAEMGVGSAVGGAVILSLTLHHGEAPPATPPSVAPAAEAQPTEGPEEAGMMAEEPDEALAVRPPAEADGNAGDEGNEGDEGIEGNKDVR